MNDPATDPAEAKSLPAWAWLLLGLLLATFAANTFIHRHDDANNAIRSAAAPPFPVAETVPFDAGSAELSDAGKTELDTAAVTMADRLDVHLRVEGYTDAMNAGPKQRTLAQQRAYAIAIYMKAKGIDGSRLTGDGFSAPHPGSTKLIADRSDTRRVQMFVQR